MPLQTGDKAPDVRLPDHDRKTVSLADFQGRQPVVLLFFPLAFTSTCTTELCTMRDDLSFYQELEAQVLAVSVDSPFVLERYRAEVGAEYPFLSDFNREASRAFGVLRESPVGPGLLNASERAVFVIDRSGTIVYSWVGAHPGLLPPFDELKAAVRAAA